MVERIPSSPPRIDSVPQKLNRPKWSVMIPVYNCASYFPSAIKSVLEQDLGPELMQIEVLDDASTDIDVESLVLELGNGRVAYYRQHENVGSLRNFESCINRSTGELIHILHGDDKVKKGFYKKMNELFDLYPEAGAAFCNHTFIDQDGEILDYSNFTEKEEGILKNSLLKIAVERPSQYVSTVVKRTVYEDLGGFYGVTYGEDWEMWVRIARKYQMIYTPKILAEYRRHEDSISWSSDGNQQNTRDLVKTISRIESILPDEYQKKFIKTKFEGALYCIAQANVSLKDYRNLNLSKEQVSLALSLNRSFQVYYHLIKLYFRIIFKTY